jgi:hypothetical protein
MESLWSYELLNLDEGGKKDSCSGQLCLGQALF